MNYADLCYGTVNERKRDGGRIREYHLESDGQIVGELVCGPITGQGPVRFELMRAQGCPLKWTCSRIERTKRRLKFLIRFAERGDELLIEIPYREEAEVLAVGDGESKLTLVKRATLLGWGVDSFRLVTNEGVEHSWSIAFEAGVAAMAEAFFRLITLGLFSKKNESWLLGSAAAKNLDTADQENLIALNVSLRMLFLPNDFTHD